MATPTRRRQRAEHDLLGQRLRQPGGGEHRKLDERHAQARPGAEPRHLRAYNETLAFDKTFTANESLPVDPGYTGYIWGEVPVIQYTGTMKIVVGNSTWIIDDMIVTSPDSSRTVTAFDTGTYAGYYPIGRPSQPPSSSSVHTTP